MHDPLIRDGWAVRRGSLGSLFQLICSHHGPVKRLYMSFTIWTTRRYPLQGRSQTETSLWENLRNIFLHEKATTGEEGWLYVDGVGDSAGGESEDGI